MKTVYRLCTTAVVSITLVGCGLSVSEKSTEIATQLSLPIGLCAMVNGDNWISGHPETLMHLAKAGHIEKYNGGSDQKLTPEYVIGVNSLHMVKEYNFRLGVLQRTLGEPNPKVAIDLLRTRGVEIEPGQDEFKLKLVCPAVPEFEMDKEYYKDAASANGSYLPIATIANMKLAYSVPNWAEKMNTVSVFKKQKSFQDMHLIYKETTLGWDEAVLLSGPYGK
ncbi:hypothetical protein [Vibrio barjaei]|uniref:hypothetical protein n=1 Tax=Vibrio barjaei TaxID=1676683 RepID=UPI002283490E|nr:hypothetical protein [Vibrio barjaei]MCY9873848.1 hypothetical protein [Vibrio barjaei]